MMLLLQALQGSFSIRTMREKSRISNFKVVSSHLIKSRGWIDSVLDDHGVLRACATPAINSTNQTSLQRITSFATRTMIHHTHELIDHLRREHTLKGFWFSDQEGSLLSSQSMYCLQEISYQANTSANVTVSDKSHDGLSATLFLLGNWHFWPLVRQAWRAYSETLDAGGVCSPSWTYVRFFSSWPT